MTALTWQDFGTDRGWASGIVSGSGNLLANLKVGFGSLAVWQAKLQEKVCHTYNGQTCAAAADALAIVPGTNLPWIDVTSSDTVLIDASAPAEIASYFDSNWTFVARGSKWTEYARPDASHGRVTSSENVEFNDSATKVGVAKIGQAMESYSVTTGSETGKLVFRTPYWPGLKVTLDGKDVTSYAVGGAILGADIPAGTTDGNLQVWFEPTGARILLPATIVGVLAIIGITIVGAFAARRKRRA